MQEDLAKLKEEVQSEQKERNDAVKEIQSVLEVKFINDDQERFTWVVRNAQVRCQGASRNGHSY